MTCGSVVCFRRIPGIDRGATGRGRVCRMRDLDGHREGLTAEDPTSVGGFELTERIGEGRQATVYRGVDANGMSSAIKVLHRERTNDGAALEAFDREVKALRAAPDAYTPRVYAEGWQDGNRFIAFEYLPGPSLEQLVAKTGPLPLPDLKGFAVGFCTIVSALHDKLIHHGDIKPRHVIAGPADRLFLIDFGIARIRDPRLRRRDLFNTAAVILYAAGGRFPYEGTPMEIASRALAGKPDLRALPEEWRDVMGRCLDPNRRRCPDVADLIRLVNR